MGRYRHAVDPRAVGAAFVGDVELGLLQLDRKVGVGSIFVVQRKIAELGIAPHFDHLGRQTELFAHISALDDDQLAGGFGWRCPQTARDSLEHAGCVCDHLAGQLAARADEQDQQDQHTQRQRGQDDQQPPVRGEPHKDPFWNGVSFRFPRDLDGERIAFHSFAQVQVLRLGCQGIFLFLSFFGRRHDGAHVPGERKVGRGAARADEHPVGEI